MNQREGVYPSGDNWRVRINKKGGKVTLYDGDESFTFMLNTEQEAQFSRWLLSRDQYSVWDGED